MGFLEIFDKKAKEENWLNFFLDLLEFLHREELKWIPDTDDQIKDTYSAILPEERINGGLKIVISIVKSDDTDCTISVEHHEDINIMAIYFLMMENETEIYGFYGYDKKIEAIVTGKENELVKSRFKNLHDKLIRSRLGSRA